jgi:methyl-accepting chemotaxis protein
MTSTPQASLPDAAPPPGSPVLLPSPPQPQGRRRISLLVKIAGNSFAIAVVITLALTVFATLQFRRKMTELFVELGRSLAVSTASSVERAQGDVERQRAQAHSARAASGVEYVFILGVDGRVVAHSFAGDFPDGLLAQTARGQGGVQESVQVRAGGRLVEVIDVEAPVQEGRLGTVHVGIRRTWIGDAVADIRSTMWLAGLVVGLLGAAMGVSFMSFVVVRPLRTLTSVTGHIVRTGDLTARVDVHSRDEVGQLAQSFQEMVSRQREVLTSLQLASEAVIQMTGALQRSAEEQREMVTRQAASLQETQVTAQEIQQTSLLAAQKAELVLEVAAKAESLGRDGEGAVDQSLAELVEVRSQVETISERMRQLGERTRQIGGITQTVKDLADQSNMLALNAAIEAVRSGEHGKGFGVVAREVRSLADQSIQSTQRVREILDDISTAIAAAVDLSAQGSERMEAGLVQVRTTGDSIRSLADIVRANLAAARQIGAAVSQQNAGIQQIFSALTDLSRLMEDTVGRINATSEAAQSLQDVSGQLVELARSYRTGAA